MNKIISVILLLSLLLVFFTGCSVPDNNDDEIPEENPQTELQSTDELILALIKYLDERLMSASAIPTSTAKKINRIKTANNPYTSHLILRTAILYADIIMVSTKMKCTTIVAKKNILG